MTMSRFIRLKLWKNCWEGAWRIIFTRELALTLTSVFFGMCWRRLYRVLTSCIVNTRSWPKNDAPLDGNKCCDIPKTFTEIKVWTKRCQFMCENDSSCSLNHSFTILTLVNLDIVILEYGHDVSSYMIV